MASGSRRVAGDLVLVEGLRLLGEALRSKCELQTVVLGEGFGTKSREEEFLKRLYSSSVKICRVTEKLLGQLSDVAAPQGALALARVPESTIEDIPPAPTPLLVCACGVQDPGNMGTLLRIAWAAGASAMIAAPGTVSFRNPKSIRASAGAAFHVPVVEGCSAPTVRAVCRRLGIQAYRADVRGGINCWAADLSRPTAFLLGSEGRGMDPSEWHGIPPIHVPMADGVESLNVAAAGAVLLFEAARQRHGGSRFDQGTAGTT